MGGLGLGDGWCRRKLGGMETKGEGGGRGGRGPGQSPACRGASHMPCPSHLDLGSPGGSDPIHTSWFSSGDGGGWVASFPTGV